MTSTRGFIANTLGPGLLFAGAAVGVSHLVQSTRAGAGFGTALVLVIIAANVFKYPGFSFGPRYAAATGTSLLEGYRRQGTWALALYGVLTVGTMFIVQAAITVVTAGLALYLFGVSWTPAVMSGVLLAVCAGVLAVGRFRWLDRITKVIVSLLTVSTVVATALAVPAIEWSEMSLWPTGDQWSWKTAAFVAPLVGWMPSALDIAVWHSLWTLAKRADSGHQSTVRESMLDFNIGYVGTAFLAICFMLLGAAVLAGKPLDPRPAVFAGQVVGLYTETLGGWSKYLIGTCAFGVMFSTTLTVMDGFPRALSTLIARFRGPEQPDEEPVAAAGPLYWIVIGTLAVGAVLVIQYGAKNFKLLVDVATAIAFLTAPALAALNHRAIYGPEVPDEGRPSERMRVFSLISIALFAVFAMWWLHIRFGT